MYTAFRIAALLINWWTESSDWPSTQVGRDVNTSPVSVGRQVINTPFSSPAYVFIASEWTGEFSWLFWIQTSPRRIRYFDASSLITSSTEKQTHVQTESQNTLTKSLPPPKKITTTKKNSSCKPYWRWKFLQQKFLAMTNRKYSCRKKSLWKKGETLKANLYGCSTVYMCEPTGRGLARSEKCSIQGSFRAKQNKFNQNSKHRPVQTTEFKC